MIQISRAFGIVVFFLVATMIQPCIAQRLPIQRLPVLPAGHPRPLVLGAVDYSAELDRALRELIRALNSHLELHKSSYRIRDTPAFMSYDDAIWRLKNGEVDVMLLSPGVYGAYRVQAKNEADVVAIASVLTGDSADKPESNYLGVLLHDPKAVNKANLASTLPTPRLPRVALVMPYSASGFLYALEALRQGGLIKGYDDLERRCQIVNVKSAQRGLDRLFSPHESDRVDIAAVHYDSIRAYLVQGENQKKVEEWLTARGITFDRTSADPVEHIKSMRAALISHCTVSETELIPHQVVVVRRANDRGVTSEIANALGAIVGALPEDQSGPLRNALAAIRIVGFAVGAEYAIDPQYDRVIDLYQKYRRVDREHGSHLNAADLMGDIVDDIRFKVAQLGTKYRPRIAIVLSGGGASGAYQDGVLNELAVAFRHARANDRNAAIRDHIRPHMFVGTSVGAINAVRSAAEIAPDGMWLRSSGPGNTNLWNTISSKAVLGDPSRRVIDWRYWTYRVLSRYGTYVVVLFITFLMILQVWLFFRMGRALRLLNGREGRKRFVALGVLGLTLLGVLVALTLGRWIGWVLVAILNALLMPVVVDDNDASAKVKRLVIVGCVLMMAGGLCLVLYSILWRNSIITTFMWLGLLSLCLASCRMIAMGKGRDVKCAVELNAMANANQQPPKRTVAISIGYWMSVFVVGVFVLLVGLLCLERPSMFKQDSLRAIIAKHLESVESNPSPATTAPVSAIRAEPAKRNVNERILERLKEANIDLVVAAADITRTSEGVQPTGVYFYVSDREPDPRFAHGTTRWVNLKDNPQLVIDAVMASSAIFPVFPPLQINEVVIRQESTPGDVLLVDGGALHNVPVAAAVQMGATHIIIIRVHPEEVPASERARVASAQRKEMTGVRMWKTFSDLFSLFYERAQAIDVEAVVEQRTYVISPQDRKIGLLDFDGHHTWWGSVDYTLNEFIKQGEYDATKGRRFRQLSCGRILARESLP